MIALEKLDEKNRVQQFHGFHAISKDDNYIFSVAAPLAGIFIRKTYCMFV